MRHLLIYIFLFCSKLISGQTIKSSHFVRSNNLIEHRLILNSDSTFKYTIKGDLVDVESQGNWYVNRRKVHLNSFASYKTGASKITSQNSECVVDSGFYYLDVKGEDSLPLVYAKIYYDGEEYTSSIQGAVIIKKRDTRSFSIEFLGDKHELFFNDKGSCITVLFSQTSRSKIYLQDAKWIFHKRKIKTNSGMILKKTQM